MAKENQMKLMTISIDIDDISLSSHLEIKKAAYEIYKNDYGFESPEKLAQQAEHVLKAVSELTHNLANKHLQICKAKDKEIQMHEFHGEEIDFLLKMLDIKS